MTQHKAISGTPITGAIVTGGAGFIGSHLCESLLRKGLPVVLVDNFCTGLRDNAETLKQHAKAKSNLHVVEADVIEPWSWVDKISPGIRSKISHVFHFASPASPPLYQDMAFATLWVNTTGLNHALEFADTIKARVVFASTSEIYGDPEISPQPESFWGNVNSFGVRSCYDEAKRFGEALIFTHNWKKKTQHGLVRIFNTYGPRMNPHDGRVVVNFLMQALRSEPLTVFGDGSQTRSFCYIDDLVDGIWRYAESELTTPVNLGNDREFSILELVETVKKMLPEKKLKVEFQDLPKDDPKQRRPDLQLAKKELAPWQPSIQLADGLKLMYAWLEQQHESI